MYILNGLEDWGLLALRVFVGLIFLLHGARKLFGTGTPVTFRFLGLFETIGALAVISGIWVQFTSIGFGIIMLGAIYMKMFKWGVKFSPKEHPGWEFDFLILGVSIALLFLGAGAYSLDAYVKVLGN
ncbi:MAG: DoxX family protein [Nanoarchaeota archaeon]